MFKDQEAVICEEELKNKECDMCKKFVNDCACEQGIYLYFKGKKPGLFKISESYIKPASALIRGHPVCQKHLGVIKRDNDFKHKRDIEITISLDLSKYRRSDL